MNIARTDYFSGRERSIAETVAFNRGFEDATRREPAA